MKIAIACIAFSSAFALITPSASADDCFDAGQCTSTFLDRVENLEVWMSSDDVLGDDEEYVPGYEEPGALVCMAPDEELGEGYESATGCTASLQRGFVLVSAVQYGKKQQRKKRKKSRCAPLETVQFGLVTTGVGGYTAAFTDNRGCGRKWITI